MPQFVPGQPIETETRVVEVTVTRDTLPPGQHRFRLIVTDDAGNVSTPALVEVVARDSQNPPQFSTRRAWQKRNKAFRFPGVARPIPRSAGFSAING
jgi:hypothetical protein